LHLEPRRNHNSARCCNTFQPSRYVYFCSEEVASLVDNVTEMNANSDAKISAFALMGKRFLQSHGAPDCLHGASKLSQDAVAGGIGNSFPVLLMCF